jgi:hypothetical protein
MRTKTFRDLVAGDEVYMFDCLGNQILRRQIEKIKKDKHNKRTTTFTMADDGGFLFSNYFYIFDDSDRSCSNWDKQELSDQRVFINEKDAYLALIKYLKGLSDNFNKKALAIEEELTSRFQNIS